MIAVQDKNWPIYLAMLVIAAVLSYQGKHYIMLIYYNAFLTGLCVMSAVLVIVAWRVGGDALDIAAPME